MEIISPGWFIWHALIGVAIGYGLRVCEHVVWSGIQAEEGRSTFGWAMMIISPCFVIGATLGWISVVLVNLVIKDATAMSFSAYLLSAFWSFVSLDFRNFFGRH